jgi:hypothetical protein
VFRKDLQSLNLGPIPGPPLARGLAALQTESGVSVRLHPVSSFETGWLEHPSASKEHRKAYPSDRNNLVRNYI